MDERSEFSKEFFVAYYKAQKQMYGAHIAHRAALASAEVAFEEAILAAASEAKLSATGPNASKAKLLITVAVAAVRCSAAIAAEESLRFANMACDAAEAEVAAANQSAKLTPIKEA